MGRRRDFDEERRRQEVLAQGVENVEGTYVREGLGRKKKAGAEFAGSHRDMASKNPPREKFTLIRRLSDEGKKLAVRGFRQLKLPVTGRSPRTVSPKARPPKKYDP